MSNRLFQGVIYQMKEAIDRVIGVIDENGIIISFSELSKIGSTCQGIREELSYTSEMITSGGYTYKSIVSGAKVDYVVFVEGEDKNAERIATILSVTLSSIKDLYDEKFDKISFIKNVILDNILPSNIYIKSKELHLASDVPRVVMLVKFMGKNDISPYQLMQNMFPDKNKDYVISIGERAFFFCNGLKSATISDSVNVTFFQPSPRSSKFLVTPVPDHSLPRLDMPRSLMLVQSVLTTSVKVSFAEVNGVVLKYTLE